MNSFISEDIKLTISSTVAAGAAGATDVTGAAIDMAGYAGCLFVVPFGPITADGVQGIRVQQCDTEGGAYADLEGTGITVADDDDNKVFYLDVKQPKERFLKLIVDRATQNSTVGAVVAMQYGARHKAVTHGANVAGEQHLNAAEGTA